MPATRVSIARLAGVSVATVDRVLRNDPAVRVETFERVQAALVSLRGERATRGRPAKSTAFKVAFVVPLIKSRFVDQVERDIALSASFFREHRIVHSFYRCDFASKQKTAQFSASVGDYDAIVLLPLDYPWVDQLIEERFEAGVPVLTIFSDQPASRRTLFLGPDNRMMGRTAGLLMGRFTPGREGTIIILSGSSRLSYQSERRTGFEQILEEDFKNLHWAVLPDFPTNEDKACAVLMTALAQYPDAVGIYETSDSPEAVRRTLTQMQSKQRIVCIGHGLSAVTRSMLTDGFMDVVLDQDSRGIVHAAGLAAVNLLNEVRGSTLPPKQSIQIFLRENVN